MSDAVFEAQCLEFFKALRHQLAAHDVEGQVEMKITATGNPCHGPFAVEFGVGTLYEDRIKGRIGEATQCVNEYLRRRWFNKSHNVTLLEYSGDVTQTGGADQA